MWKFFTTVECRISSRLKRYKNYKNRLRLAKVIVKTKMSRFLWFSVYKDFASGKIPLGGKSPRKCIYRPSVPALETAKHREKFGWPVLSDIAAVTKPRRETCWNFPGCPKLANRSQPLVDRSSPYCKHIWRRYCHLTVSFRLSIRTFFAKTQPDKIVRWCADGDFFAHNFCVL